MNEPSSHAVVENWRSFNIRDARIRMSWARKHGLGGQTVPTRPTHKFVKLMCHVNPFLAATSVRPGSHFRYVCMSTIIADHDRKTCLYSKLHLRPKDSAYARLPCLAVCRRRRISPSQAQDATNCCASSRDQAWNVVLRYGTLPRSDAKSA